MGTPFEQLEVFDETGHVRPLNDLLIEALHAGLRDCDGNLSRLSREMRVSRGAVYRMLNGGQRER